VDRGFIWTPKVGMQSTGTLWPLHLSGDGSTIIMWSDEESKQLLWSPDGTTIDVPRGLAGGISGDGQTFVGGSIGNDPTRRWKADGPVEPIDITGTLGGKTTTRWEPIGGVSFDGSIIVGGATLESPSGELTTVSYLWNESNGIRELGGISGVTHSKADLVTSDGTFAAGTSQEDSRWVTKGIPWFWSLATGTEKFTGWDDRIADLYGLSRGGAVVVGGRRFASDVADDATAFVWDRANGVQDLYSVLADQYGLSEALDGWELTAARGISDDGLTIAGNGRDPDGERAAWIVELDRPIALYGDFDDDRLYTVADIDALSKAVAAGRYGLGFDLDRDGELAPSDREHWIGNLFGSWVGDADLDRDVDFNDFLSLSSNFDMPGSWAEGDFTGDGQVSFEDFLSLSQNFGNGSATAQTVPEPNGGSLWLGICLLVLMRRRD